MVDDLWFMVWSLGLTRRLGKLGQRGCHRLDELLLPVPRVENLEVHAGSAQKVSTLRGEAFHCCLVVAQKVEQSAHLLRGFLRSPACLVRAWGSTSACVFVRAW